MLKDKFLRNHDYLRVSITDKCNLRCRYCMPPEGIEFMKHDEILKNEEFVRLISIMVRMGVKKVRFTGGEPLVRRDFQNIIAETHRLHPGVELCVTTNGVVLGEHIELLKRNGVTKINISMDTLSPQRFMELTGRDSFAAVKANLEKVLSFNCFDVKVNAVLLRNTLDELKDFLDYFQDKDATLRFIERMPVTDEDSFNEFIPSDRLVELLSGFGELKAVRADEHGVAMRYDMIYNSRKIRLGVIPPMTHKFCASCNRLRITSDGHLKTCLHSDRQYDLKGPMRSGAADEEIMELVSRAVKEKWDGHKMECSADNGGCRAIHSEIKSMSSVGG